MSAAQAKAQLSMWAIAAAPLILGSDPRVLSPGTIRMLENRRVIAVDQDPRGIQGTAVQRKGSGQVWAKRLVGGQLAVALLNRGSRSLRITTSARRIGLRRSRAYRLQDLWSGTTKRTSGLITARVPPRGVVMYRITAL